METVNVLTINKKATTNVDLIISNLSIFVLFMMMLFSMNPWFTWYHNSILVGISSFLFLFLRLFLFQMKMPYKMFSTVILIFLLFPWLLLLTDSSKLGFLRLIPILFLGILMRPEEKRKILPFTTQMYAWIVGISMIFYVLIVFLNVRLPYSIIVHPVVVHYPPFRNYIFLLNLDGPQPFYRFRSIFTEPGHLGTISAFLLYINRYELKRKSVLIIFISVILSFSLAGYVLLVLGYLIQMAANSKHIYKTTLKIAIAIILLGGMGYYFYSKYPDALVSSLILERLEYDEDTGSIRGNNRNSDSFNYYYKTYFLTSTENILLGKRLSDSEYMAVFGNGGNNSYKVFLLKYGSISLLLLFLLYLSIVAVNPSRLGFGLLLLFSASFIQRTYALWDMQLFLFIGAIQYFYTESNSLYHPIKQHQS